MGFTVLNPSLLFLTFSLLVFFHFVKPYFSIKVGINILGHLVVVRYVQQKKKKKKKKKKTIYIYIYNIYIYIYIYIRNTQNASFYERSGSVLSGSHFLLILGVSLFRLGSLYHFPLSALLFLLYILNIPSDSVLLFQGCYSIYNFRWLGQVGLFGIPILLRGLRLVLCCKV